MWLFVALGSWLLYTGISSSQRSFSRVSSLREASISSSFFPLLLLLFFSRNIFFFPSCSRNKSRWESTQRRQFHSKDWRPMVRKLTRKHANCWRIRGVAGHSRLFTMKGARTWPHPMFIRLCCSSSRQSTMFLAHSYPPAQELLINFFTRRASFLSPVRSRMLHSRRICKRLPSPRS